MRSASTDHLLSNSAGESGPSKNELKKRAKEAEKQKKAAENAAKAEKLEQDKARAEVVRPM